MLVTVVGVPVAAEDKIQRSALWIFAHGGEIAAQIDCDTENVVHNEVRSLENVGVYALKNVFIGLSVITKINHVCIVYMSGRALRDAAGLARNIKAARRI